MKILGIDNVFLPVGNLAEAVTFYHDLLGLPVHRRFDEMGMALFQIGDETPGLGIGVVEGTPNPGAGKIWFEVPDARSTADEMSTKGVVSLAEPFEIPTGWAFEVRDPWGNVLGFTDYTVKPELGRS
jgi:predicted enzyme related to lactoylglutathione lyase